MKRSIANVTDPRAIPEVWIVSSKGHDQVPSTALVHLEHEGWEPVAVDVGSTGGTGGGPVLPPPGTAVSVSWEPARRGGFRAASFVDVEELRAAQAEAEAWQAAQPPPVSLEHWLAAMQSLGLLTGHTAAGLADLLDALDRYFLGDAGEEPRSPATMLDREAATDVLWSISRERNALDREDPDHPLHDVGDDPTLPVIVLVDEDATPAAQLAPLVGAAARAAKADRDLDAQIAYVRRRMAKMGAAAVPFLADGADQAEQYIVLLDEALAAAIEERNLLALHR